MADEKAKAVVYTPIKKPHPRKGKGFSIDEIREAGLILNEAKKLGIPIDRRRRTSHSQNVQCLKEEFVAVIPLTEIKGIGAVTEKMLIDANILDAYDLAQVDLDEISKKVSYSKKIIQKWQREAKKLLKK